MRLKLAGMIIVGTLTFGSSAVSADDPYYFLRVAPEPEVERILVTEETITPPKAGDGGLFLTEER